MPGCYNLPLLAREAICITTERCQTTDMGFKNPPRKSFTGLGFARAGEEGREK